MTKLHMCNQRHWFIVAIQWTFFFQADEHCITLASYLHNKILFDVHEKTHSSWDKRFKFYSSSSSRFCTEVDLHEQCNVYQSTKLELSLFKNNITYCYYLDIRYVLKDFHKILEGFKRMFHHLDCNWIAKVSNGNLPLFLFMHIF